MRGTIRLLSVLAAGALLAGLIGITTASGQTVMHLVLPGDSLRIRTVDHDRDGLRPGDRVASRGVVTDDTGTPVGKAYGDCVVQRRITSPVRGLWRCSYVLGLAEGDLILEGLDPRGPGGSEMAVLGGTGAYSAASGDATFTDTFDESSNLDTTDMVITLTT